MRHRQRTGFTLLEIGIVLLVLSIMLGGTLAAMAQKSRLAKQQELRMKLDAIEDALMAFRKAGAGGGPNVRLPCPADATSDMTSADFGLEAANPGICSGGSPAATLDDGQNTVGGVVPVKTLGLPDDYMFDPWGGRFDYIVDKRLTAIGAFDAYWPSGGPVHGVDDDSTRVGSITIKDHHVIGGVDVVSIWTTHAVVAIVSHGPNGHGAFQLKGRRPDNSWNLKSSGSNNSDEQQNCHCDASGNALTFDATFVVQASPSNAAEALPNTFDDTVRFYGRASFLSASDRMTEAR
jgi:type II secretory pathway pseudopilin PulG